ncbi:hypothetical protein HPB50_021461 [Hyalomma asiaticum]|uniref:Uncharacterized protein n=1 Tax=Hyalomma asiaticum TaxID=266040 RepID=A0ACB7RYL4_HYAAI|nr:hypothetical protein HPB50_021461 [Hyalomma asiaticum]
MCTSEDPEQLTCAHFVALVPPLTQEIVKKCMRQAAAEAAAAQTTPECPSTSTTHHSCSVVGCQPSDWQREQSQHRVPTQGSRRAEWLRRMGLPLSDGRQDLRVCGRHFTPADYHHNFTMMQQFGVSMRKYPLRADALPSLFLPTSKEHHTSKPDGVGQACSCSKAVTAKGAGKRLGLKTVAAQATCEKRTIATQVHLSLKRKMPVCVKTQTEPLTAEAAVQT